MSDTYTWLNCIEHIEGWTWKCFKCYWIKKQIALFCTQPLIYWGYLRCCFIHGLHTVVSLELYTRMLM